MTSMYEHASATICEGVRGYVDEVYICLLSKAGYTLFSFSLGLLTYRFGKIKEREESVFISLNQGFLLNILFMVRS